ncbi:primase-helicase family protein [Brevundimonas sp.]|uniref:primase-helicase family protein n=1 Tax=Brevundimonas sp. TaxID=1871086 RepID=UPI0035B3774E
MTEEIERRSNEGRDLFHTYAVFDHPPGGGRGNGSKISAVIGAFLDIDIGESGRYVENGKNPAASLEDIKADLIAWGLPLPSALVASGNGIHAEFRLDQPFRISSEADREAAQAMLKGLNGFAIEKAGQQGIKLDAMSDLPRVKRAAGSTNWKDRENPKAVEVLELHLDRTYTFTELAAFQPSARPVGPALKAKAKASAGADHLPIWDLITEHCPFVRYCVENAANLPYPYWFACLGIAARCDGGEAIAHDLSSRDGRYTKGETDAKIAEVLKAEGPVTYAYIRDQLGFDGVDADILASRMHSPIQFGSSSDALIGLQRTYAYDLSSERFYNLATLTTQSHKAFDMAHGDVLPSPVAAFRTSPLSIKASSVDYLPGQPRLVGDRRHPVLNVYRASGLKPVEGNCSTILAHFDYLIPDPAQRDHVLDYLACMVQRPGQKITSALLFIGGQGNGKSTVVRWVTDFLGHTNVKTLPTEAISSPFQADRANIQCLVLNEVHGIDRAGANGLKSWITEEDMNVHEKGTPRFKARTPRAVILISNHLDALDLEEGDRRYVAIQTTANRANPDYFERLNKASSKELPAFAAWLGARDISKFDPYAPAPESELKGLMIRSSQSPLEAAIKEAIDEEVGCFRHDFGTAQDVISTLVARGIEFRRPRPSSVGTILSKMGFEQLPQQRVGEAKYRFWVWRNSERWSRAQPSEVASYYLPPIGPANDNTTHSSAA